MFVENVLRHVYVSPAAAGSWRTLHFSRRLYVTGLREKGAVFEQKASLAIKDIEANGKMHPCPGTISRSTERHSKVLTSSENSSHLGCRTTRKFRRRRFFRSVFLLAMRTSLTMEIPDAHPHSQIYPQFVKSGAKMAP